MPDTLLVKRAGLKDLHFLSEFCVRLYTHYFADYWEKGGLEQYLEEQFGLEKIKSDLFSYSIHYYLIETDQQAAGFIKINSNTNLGDFKECCELEKMYLLPDFKGLGYGRSALTQVRSRMKQLGKKWMFLEVLKTNKKAIQFYFQQGFRYYDSKDLSYPLFKKERNTLHRMILKI